MDRRDIVKLGLVASTWAISGPVFATNNREILSCNLWDENLDPEAYGSQYGAVIKLVAVGALAQKYSLHLPRLPFRYRTKNLHSLNDLQLELSTPHLLFIAVDFNIEQDRKICRGIARMAKNKGILTVTTAIGSTPNLWSSGLGKYLQIPVFQALDVLGHVTSGIAQIINVQGHVGFDFEDFRTVLTAPGHAHACSFQAGGHDRAQIAAINAVQTLRNQGVHLLDASCALVTISAAKDSLRFKELQSAMTIIKKHFDRASSVIYGTYQDDTLTDHIRITLIPTGLPHMTNVV